MKARHTFQVTLIVVGVFLILAIVGGLYLNGQSEQRSKAQAALTQATLAEQAQQAAEAQSQERADQMQAKKVAAQDTLNKCLANVNNQVSQAISQVTPTPTAPEVSEDAETQMLQVQQTFTTQCQDTYNATVNAINP